MHRRKWVCSESCHQAFQTAQSFVKHLRDNHQDQSEEDRLPLLLALSERPVSDETIERCPLCPTNLPLSALLPHIAQHLEQLSLFVLSSSVNEIENSGLDSDVSHQAHDDYSNHMDDVTATSSTVSNRLAERDDQEVDVIIDDSTVTNEISKESLVPEEDMQDWTQIFDAKQASARSAEPDPILVSLQKQQTQQSGPQGPKKFQTGIDSIGPEFKDREILRDFIDKQMAIVMFDGAEQRFLPKAAFERATTRAVIKQTIDTEGVWLRGGTLLTRSKDFDIAVHIHTSCRKIFATWLSSGQPTTLLTALINSGISDAQFPLVTEDCPLLLRPSLRGQHFINRQRFFNPAYFELGSFQVLDSSWTIPIYLNSPVPIWKGYWSEIYDVQIHPEQHSFLPVGFLITSIITDCELT